MAEGSKTSKTAPRGVSKSQYVYEMLRERITSGTYASGQRLVLEQLAREFGVSPVPVREAIRKLEAEGYARYQRNVGAEVASIDAAEYTDVMEGLAYLEGAATAMAVPVLTSEELRRARQINDAMAVSLRDFDPLGFTRRNQELHELLCGRCPNRHFLGLLRREWERMNLIRRSTFALVPGRARTSVDEHDQILTLIETGASVSEVEIAAREHKLNTLRAFLAHVNRTPEPWTA